MMDLLTRLRSSGWIARLTPAWMRALAYRARGGPRNDRSLWQAEYDRVLSSAKRAPAKCDVKLGIVKDLMLRHSYYEAACLELGVPYSLVDIARSDWMEELKESGCNVFLVRPYVLDRVGKALYDSRLRIMTEDLGYEIFPSPKSLWLYESKWRTAEWLDAHGVRQPRTRIFFHQKEAEEFVRNASLPLVFKTDIGAEALGVVIVRDAGEGLNLVRKCFGRGYLPPRHESRDRQWGYVIFQDFIPDAREWRVVRIGNSFFAHRKGRKGDFHSGSKVIEYDTPPRQLLDFCRRFLDEGQFDNMAVDVLERSEGEYFVIELHAYFGCNQPNVMEVDGRPGRYLYDGDKDEYAFEEGDFNRNASCNVRVEWVVGGALHGG